MGEKLDSDLLLEIRRQVAWAFAYRKRVTGRDSVIFRGETYFRQPDLVRTVERIYREEGKLPFSRECAQNLL